MKCSGKCSFFVLTGNGVDYAVLIFHQTGTF